ncbi:MAG: hypothetical protein KatS3mg118_0649 [Paracoccaceae bacterium]|nr:MAG: hypothetical protein KatS3mg118_0649 [Paracoccaceae bacterium]
MGRDDTRITVVCATYNRAAVLQRCLRTLIGQSVQDWVALVIGDRCTDDSAERVAALGDPRIRFINLPARFGEQAGPNSVGMALARTPLLAFLNHDDYWFPDHLERGLDALSRGGDLYWARAAFFTNRGARDDRAIFIEASPPARSLAGALDGPRHYAEPLSAWIARAEALARLGPMRLAGQSGLVPLIDYCARAWRAGLRLVCGTEITVLKDRMVAAGHAYSGDAPFAEEWVAMMRGGRSAELKAMIADDLWLAAALGMARPFDPPPTGSGMARHAAIERASGIPIADMTAAARGEGPSLIGEVLMRRTGERLTEQPDLGAMIAAARAQLG